MRPHVKISHSKRFKPVGEVEPQDVAAILEEGNHLPKGTLSYIDTLCESIHLTCRSGLYQGIRL